MYAKRSARVLKGVAPTWESFEVHTMRLLRAVGEWGILIEGAVSCKAKLVLKVEGAGLYASTYRPSNCGACVHQQVYGHS